MEDKQLPGEGRCGTDGVSAPTAEVGDEGLFSLANYATTYYTEARCLKYDYILYTIRSSSRKAVQKTADMYRRDSKCHCSSPNVLVSSQTTWHTHYWRSLVISHVVVCGGGKEF